MLAKGEIARTGGPELAEQLEAEGYAGLLGADAVEPEHDVAARPVIDDPFGGPGGDPFADPLA